MTKEEYLQKATELSLELELLYKARLYDEVLKPMIDSGLISGPSGDESWYSLRSFDDLITILGDRMGYDAIFRIPTTCGTWYNAEVDPITLKPFRFFCGTAWLTVKIPPGSRSIYITVIHAIDYKFFDDVTIKINDVALPPATRDIDNHGRTVLNFALPTNPMVTGDVKLELVTNIFDVPALKFENNSDWRRISAAIFYPDFA
ncbi:hypothetical protein [Massilia timonae]|uniref:hypothetical protein n=1 Tax=Massilia timonae TaxID=47229 RepID=UPI002356350D|nr:hypothetical protein [Massilia timonae]